MNWSKFTMKEGNQIHAIPCIEIVAFSYDSPEASGPGFDRFLRVFTERFGDHLTFYRTGDMKRLRSFDSRTLDAPYHWFSDDQILTTKMLSFEVSAGDSQQSICPPALDLTLWGGADRPSFVFRMALPIEEGDVPDDIVSFVQEALSDFPLENGYCGYSFFWDNVSRKKKDIYTWTAPHLLRHPGFGYGTVMQLANAAVQGVVAVNWLTFLGPRITENLGELKALESRCPQGVSALPLGKGGALLRAGHAPEIGDVNRQDLLPLYRAVGQLVTPSRTTDTALDDLVIKGMTEEDANDWLRRFFV